MLNISHAIEVVTDGLANRDKDAHKRHHTIDEKGNVSATSQWPACQPEDKNPARWRTYGYGRALELGAALCMEPACFGFGGAA